MTELMKAWQVSKPGELDCLKWVELARPEPAGNECLVRVKAAALNFSDVLMVGGKYQIKPPLPFTPGQEISGSIVYPERLQNIWSGKKLPAKCLGEGSPNIVLLETI